MNQKQIETLSNTSPILFYDGECYLCNGFVNWLIKRDKRKVFLFAPLQQSTGIELRHKLGMAEDINSVVLLSEGKYFLKSSVSFKIASRLGFPYSLLRVFSVLPKALRDRVYDWVAANRYKWYGKADTCIIPSEDIIKRFILD
jgi:predicted DCC family thiol-disulfide oxidoreductase YuxK